MLAKHSREQNVPCGQLEVGDQRLRHVTETGSELASPTYSPYIHREIPPPSFACTVFAAVWVVWQQNGAAVRYTTVKPVLKTCTSSHALLSHPVMKSKLVWPSQTREEAYPWITFRDRDTFSSGLQYKKANMYCFKPMIFESLFPPSLQWLIKSSRLESYIF